MKTEHETVTYVTYLNPMAFQETTMNTYEYYACLIYQKLDIHIICIYLYEI